MRVISKRNDSQVRIRLPKDMKELIAKVAFDNGRSINSEILVRLKLTLTQIKIIKKVRSE
jgi:hypothetical protein